MQKGLDGAGDAPNHGLSRSGESRGPRPAPVHNIRQAFLNISEDLDGTLVANVEAGRRFRDLLGARYYDTNLLELLRIANGEYSDDINRLFYKPGEDESSIYSNVTATFLSLAAEKGPAYWPVCEALITSGAKVDLGSPLPVVCFRDTLSFSDMANPDVCAKVKSLMKDLSQEQLQILFDSYSLLRGFNYYSYCLHPDMLKFFMDKGCTICEDGIVSLLNQYLLRLAEPSRFIGILNEWAQRQGLRNLLNMPELRCIDMIRKYGTK